MYEINVCAILFTYVRERERERERERSPVINTYYVFNGLDDTHDLWNSF